MSVVGSSASLRTSIVAHSTFLHGYFRPEWTKDAGHALITVLRTRTRATMHSGRGPGQFSNRRGKLFWFNLGLLPRSVHEGFIAIILGKGLGGLEGEFV